MLVGLAGMIYKRDWVEISFSWPFFFVCLSGFMGHLQQLALVLAVRNESPSTVNIIESLAVVWSLLGDLFILGVGISFEQCCGIALVGFSCIWISKLNAKK